MPVEMWLLIAKRLSGSDLNMIGATDRYVRSITMPLLRGCKLLKLLTTEDEDSSVDFLEKAKYIDIRV